MQTIALWFLLAVPWRLDVQAPQFPLVSDLASCERMREAYMRGLKATAYNTEGTFTQCIQVNTPKP